MSHINEKLSAYCNQELTMEERQEVADHLLRCQRCRKDYDEIKLGVALAQQLPRVDAPHGMWNEIERSLANQKQKESFVSSPFLSILSWQSLVAACAVLLLVVGLSFVWYLKTNKKVEVVNDNRKQEEKKEVIATLPSPTPQPIVSPTPQPQEPKETMASQEETPKQQRPNQPKNETVVSSAAWQVDCIEGAPKVGERTITDTGSLSVGQYLETDNNSRARIEVADIGQVEVAPNSRVKLVRTKETEHRLALDKGTLQAKIFAPPRLFIVDTPSAIAVDLGCEYTLDVDEEGNSTLHVTGGFVALERDGRESIVPAGAICHTKRGKGIGTPYFDDASQALREALTKFDFQNGGSVSVKTIIAESRAYDTLTLWHLLQRVSGKDRELVYDAIASFVNPPKGVTREGVLKLNKEMLERWQVELENLWFG